MKCLETGHIYQPRNRHAGTGEHGQTYDQTITFINRQPGQEHDGTTTQEVIRILLDRTRHCANCLPHPNNERIIYHLRMALALHEARALERKIEKGDLIPEYVPTGNDGHFDMPCIDGEEMANFTTHLLPHRMDWEKVPTHPIAVKKAEEPAGSEPMKFGVGAPRTKPTSAYDNLKLRR